MLGPHVDCIPVGTWATASVLETAATIPIASALREPSDLDADVGSTDVADQDNLDGFADRW